MGGGVQMTPEQQWALNLALELDCPAFPCKSRPGTKDDKAPACPHSFKDACTAAGGLATLWARYPGELVGVPTGDASGIAVLDVDPRHNGHRWLEENRSRLPTTRAHRTRSGGVHYVFKHRAGLKCSTGKIAPGIDVRAEGGYVIWWPLTGLKARNVALATWPDWLVPAEPPRPVPYVKAWPRPAGAAYSMSVENKLKGISKRLQHAREGERNAVLFWAACRIGELVNVGAAHPDFGRDLLVVAATRAGLAAAEAQRTIASAMRAAA
jgi:hypothetical protein